MRPSHSFFPISTHFIVLLLSLSTFALSLPAAASTYVNFQVPGALTTQPQGVNNSGAVTGYWSDAVTSHGFLRQADGALTSFDVSGSIATYAFSINSAGMIVGYYLDSSYGAHGFLRTLDNQVTTIDAPNAGSVIGTGTFANYLNDGGEVAGYYVDQNFVPHGFLRDATGNLTTIDVPGAVGTVVRGGLNRRGELTGWYQVADHSFHSFLRDAFGNIANIDVPGSVQTYAQGINSFGEITGYYWPSSASVQNFVRDPAGNLTFFYPACSSNCNANVLGIDDNGNVVGEYDVQVERGFVYSAAGVLTYFRDPGSGTSKGQGTFPSAVSGNGKITGWFQDSSNGVHGFLSY
jgi:hypothetical protein